MKKTIITLSSLLILNNANAISLNDALEKLGNTNQIAYEGVVPPPSIPSNNAATPPNQVMEKSTIKGATNKSDKNLTDEQASQSLVKQDISNEEGQNQKNNNDNQNVEEFDLNPAYEDQALDEEFTAIGLQLQELKKSISNNVVTGSVLQREIKKLNKKTSSINSTSLILSAILFSIIAIISIFIFRIRKTMDIKFNEVYSNLSNKNPSDISDKIEDLETKIAYLGSGVQNNAKNINEAFAEVSELNKNIEPNIQNNTEQYQPKNPSENIENIPKPNYKNIENNQSFDDISLDIDSMNQNPIEENFQEKIIPQEINKTEGSLISDKIDINTEIKAVNVSNQQTEEVNTTNSNVEENIDNKQEAIPTQPSEEDFLDLYQDNNEPNNAKINSTEFTDNKENN